MKNRPEFSLILPAFVLAFTLWSREAEAIRGTFFTGTNTHVSLDSCCNSAGGRTGVGLLASLETPFVESLDVVALSSGRWNEVSVLYPYYWLGQPTVLRQRDGTFDSEKTVSRYRLVSSIGVGYFNHTVTTKSLNLPLLTSGVLVNNYNYLIRSLGEKWFLSGLFQLNWASTKSGSSISHGLYLGIGYEF